MPLRTPLHDRHVALGARMVEFAGYDMPLQYSGIRDEHVAVRERAGVFDVSHMGEVAVHGRDAEAAVQRLMTNDVSRLAPGQAVYSVMCTDDGGIVDDCVVYRGFDPGHFLVVVNASTRLKDVAWMRDHLVGDAEVTDLSDEVALLAVQGPRAVDVVEPLIELDGGGSLDDLSHFHSSGARMAGIPDSPLAG